MSIMKALFNFSPVSCFVVILQSFNSTFAWITCVNTSFLNKMTSTKKMVVVEPKE